MPSLPSRIKKYNKGRIPHLLAIKYEHMAENIFRFYRGTAHLFYEDLCKTELFLRSPKTWICGDLHMENFGSYKSEERLVYFDINDFDEAVLAPCLYDISRALCGFYISGNSMGMSAAESHNMATAFLDAYTHVLKTGHVGQVQKETTKGLVRNLLVKVSRRKRKEFIAERTEIRNKKLRLIIDDKKVSALNAADKQRIKNRIEAWGNKLGHYYFYKVLDIGYRIAGTGSMGLERYVILINGLGDGKHYLLDLKVAHPSCIEKHLKKRQPRWDNEAQRITEIQTRMQASVPDMLSPIKINNQWFIVKEMQPTADKIDIAKFKNKDAKLEDVAYTMGCITAYAHLRSGGRDGSAIADELIAFAKQPKWQKEVLAYAWQYAQKVEKNYAEYLEAYKDGYFRK